MISRFCACGLPLHYASQSERRSVEEIEQKQGSDQLVAIGQPRRLFLVQRHYLHLHANAGNAIVDFGFPEIIEGKTVRVHYMYDRGTIDLSLDQSLHNQRFQHIDLEGNVRHFYIPKLLELVEANETAVETVRYAIESMLPAMGEIDQAYAASLDPARLDVPGLRCVFPDTSELFVDGHHRLARRVQLGYDFMDVISIPEYIWKKSLLKIYDDYA